MSESTLEKEVAEGFEKLTGGVQSTQDDGISFATAVRRVPNKFFFDNEKDGKVTLTSESGEKLAGENWDTAAEFVAKNYFNLGAKDIKAYQTTKGKSGKSNFESLVEPVIGSKDAYKASVGSGKRILTLEEFEALGRPLIENFSRYSVTQIMQSKIKDFKSAEGALRYLADLKGLFPKALGSIAIPKEVKSIDEVQNLYVQIVSALPRDYTTIRANYGLAAASGKHGTN